MLSFVVMGCVFCDIVAGRQRASVIYTDDLVTAFMTLRPSQAGECMVIPKEHIDHFTDLPDESAARIIIVAQRIGRRMQAVFAPKRVGMVVHGFGVPHAHLLIVPQHNIDDITSARFARTLDGKIVFDMKNVAPRTREQLDQDAESLRIQ
ncbi:MAG TPA: HIT family protein [Acidobacteriaceae bacterium]|nr:HIT family protein [Acidobacteriaceae bacterium]